MLWGGTYSGLPLLIRVDVVHDGITASTLLVRVDVIDDSICPFFVGVDVIHDSVTTGTLFVGIDVVHNGISALLIRVNIIRDCRIGPLLVRLVNTQLSEILWGFRCYHCRTLRMGAASAREPSAAIRRTWPVGTLMIALSDVGWELKM